MNQGSNSWELHDLGGTIGKRIGELPGAYEAVERHILRFYIGRGLEPAAAEERSQKLKTLLGELREFNRGQRSTKPSLTEFGGDITDTLMLAIQDKDFAKPDLLYDDATEYLIRQSKRDVCLALFSDASTLYIDTCLEEVVEGTRVRDAFTKIFLGSEQGPKKEPQTYKRIYQDISSNGGLVKRVVDDDLSACKAALSAAQELRIAPKVYMISRNANPTRKSDSPLPEGIDALSSYWQLLGGTEDGVGN